ncbi:MAG: hypothetical protein GX785_17210 [Armatimonadetes bacterium]|nr:hypothetical protein [Armatimonadota bacterium]
MNLPDIWGPGQLLAFSGIDGHTDWAKPFVLHTGARPGGLLVRLPATIAVGFEGMPPLRFQAILGDAITAESPGGAYRAVFLDHHTLAGELPEGTRMTVDGRSAGEDALSVDAGPMKLVAATRGRRWALLLSDASATDVAERLTQALGADLTPVFEQREAFVRRVRIPEGLSPERERLLRKAVSVMKVNTEAPCGVIRRRWTTPDRWPHRHMWLWDSAFHSMGIAYVDMDLAKDAVLAMLEQVHEDGLLPHMVPAGGTPSTITQPPVLAWATLRILRLSGDVEWAAECLPYLHRYLEWMRLNRDKNGNGIPEWHIAGDPLCRSGESGLDNSPRFDRAVLLDAVDFASFLSHDLECLGEIAARVGNQALQAECEAHARRIAEAVNALLWSDDEGFYLDRDFEGRLSEVKAVTGFLPLLAGIPNAGQAEALCQHLSNPRTFGAPLPVPSVSLDSGSYCKDMWRGPTWMNLNYAILCGLLRAGFHEEAAQLRERSLAAMQRIYETDGCFYEYYDSLDVTHPSRLDRKQRLMSGQGIAPISDYHWTAALTAAMIFEG